MSCFQMFEDLSTESLDEIYHDILSAKEIGLRAKSLDKYIQAIQKELKVSFAAAWKMSEDLFYQEVAKRYFDLISKIKEQSIDKGDEVFYLNDDGSIEHGIVSFIEYDKGKIVTIGVDFENDFDSLYGTALGKTLFRSREAAVLKRKEI